MKELSIEEKAKRYDKAIETTRKWYDSNTNDGYRGIFEDIFPELKESEDERIRKEIIDIINSQKEQQCHIDSTIYDEMIAWLEKQGEHANFRNKIQIGDKVTRNKDGVLVNLSQLNRVAKKDEKQREQKPADKVEPKFHKGEWITNGIDFTFQIHSIEDNMYLRSDDYFIDIETADKKFRLWTIQDAKDGDVLFYRDGQWIFIYKGIVTEDTFKYYALLSEKGITVNDAAFSLLTSCIIPATKEQRDNLMKAMDDAGYIFDFEKKELKKIEQKTEEYNITGIGSKKAQGKLGKMINNLKSINKVEPKFKIGDLITNGILIGKIDEINEHGYHAHFGDHYADIPDIENWHKWTIQDAKDGDVLSWDDSKCIAIFKNIYDEDSFNSYGFVGGCTGTFESRQSYHDIEGAHPATKEQRDILIKAMDDAGYTFDFEKKELKKIEQKPAEWRREDEQNLNACLGYIPDEFLRRWLKDIIHAKYDKSAWNEEDNEHSERILKELESQYQKPINSPYLDKIESDYNWAQISQTSEQVEAE